MEKTNFTDNAVFESGKDCLTDTSGVKEGAVTVPDGDGDSRICAADGEKSPVTGAINEAKGDASATADEELEAEFDALINGKFKELYKKRTEGIIRKRLRSAGKPRAAVKEAESQAASEIKAPKNEEHGTATEQDADAYEHTRAQNKNRPMENGLRGSCGMVTKINVSALDGSGVLAILRRVDAGEKISFK